MDSESTGTGAYKLVLHVGGDKDDQEEVVWDSEATPMSEADYQELLTILFGE